MYNAYSGLHDWTPGKNVVRAKRPESQRQYVTQFVDKLGTRSIRIAILAYRELPVSQFLIHTRNSIQLFLHTAQISVIFYMCQISPKIDGRARRIDRFLPFSRDILH